MILLISLIILTAIFGGFYWKAHNEGVFMPNSGLLAIISAIMLFSVIVLIFLNSYTVKGEIAEYYAVKATITNSRTTDIAEIERAALTQKIIETNKWLAKIQYDNNTIWDIFIPDEVNNLEPLK